MNVTLPRFTVLCDVLAERVCAADLVEFKLRSRSELKINDVQSLKVFLMLSCYCSETYGLERDRENIMIASNDLLNVS